MVFSISGIGKAVLNFCLLEKPRTVEVSGWARATRVAGKGLDAIGDGSEPQMGWYLGNRWGLWITSPRIIQLSVAIARHYRRIASS